MILQAKLFKIQHSNILLGKYFISLHVLFLNNFQVSNEAVWNKQLFTTIECQVYA